MLSLFLRGKIGVQKMNIVEVLKFIKEIIADDKKMAKFKEVITDIKELVYDIKDAVEFFKKENK